MTLRQTPDIRDCHFQLFFNDVEETSSLNEIDKISSSFNELYRNRTNVIALFCLEITCFHVSTVIEIHKECYEQVILLLFSVYRQTRYMTCFVRDNLFT